MTNLYTLYRMRYQALMARRISDLHEVEGWMAAMQGLLEHALTDGINLFELTRPVQVGFWGTES